MRVADELLKAPIHLYRWTLKPYVGWNCRQLPTCSEYALEAIDRNGAWRGLWLTVARLSRCHPWGSHGHDPVPDIRAERHPFAPWRYGRWRYINSPAGDHPAKEPAVVQRPRTR